MGTYQSHGKFIISPDGTKMWAEAAGNHEKPAVVFIHGFLLSGTVWEKQFQDTFLLENLYLLRYDLRGHGRSEHPVEPEAYASVRIAEDFAAVCSAFGVKLPYIAGWSFGGLIAADVCDRYGPEAIAGNILLGGVPYKAAHPEIGDPWLLNLAPRLLSSEVAVFSQACSEFVDSCFSSEISQNMKWALIGTITAQNPTARLLLAMREQNETALLSAGPSVPFLVIQGTADRHIQYKKLENLMKRNFAGNYTFHLLSGVGHACFYERPTETNKWIVEFVQSVEQSRASHRSTQVS